jgi:hypothetical protein
VNKKKQKNFGPLSFGLCRRALFILAGGERDRETSSVQSFFASFCSQKEDSSPLK